MLDYLPHVALALIFGAVAGLGALFFAAGARYREWEERDARQGPPAVRMPPVHPRTALPKPEIRIVVRDHASAPAAEMRRRLAQLMPSHVSNQPPEAA